MASVEAKLAKVAAIREPGHPIGQPAPCYLNCRCGAKPPAYRGDVTCACGTRYSEDGWILSTPTPEGA